MQPLWHTGDGAAAEVSGSGVEVVDDALPQFVTADVRGHESGDRRVVAAEQPEQDVLGTDDPLVTGDCFPEGQFEVGNRPASALGHMPVPGLQDPVAKNLSSTAPGSARSSDWAAIQSSEKYVSL